MRIIGLILALVTLLIDQASKLIIVKYYADKQLEITNFFNISLVYNRGISFGLFNNLAYSNYLFCVFAIVILVYLLKWIRTSEKQSEIIALGLIIGGAVGNIVDRLVYHGVVDFLEFHWNQYYWPSFNIADSAICLGVCILLFFSIDLRRKVTTKE